MLDSIKKAFVRNRNEEHSAEKNAAGGLQFLSSNQIDRAYWMMRGRRTSANYIELVKAFLADIRQNATFPFPRTTKEALEETKVGRMLCTVMNTPVGTLVVLYTDAKRMYDKDDPTGEETAVVLCVKCSGYFPAEDPEGRRDGIILNPYDSYGGVVIARKDVDWVLAHRSDDAELEIDPSEGVRLNLALAHWWLIEGGRYGTRSKATGRLCPDCGYEYNGGDVCPRCGYDWIVGHETSLIQDSYWINHHETEWGDLIHAIDCGQREKSAATEFLDRMSASSGTDSTAAHFLGKVIARDNPGEAYKWLLGASRAGNACAMVDLGKTIADHVRNEDEVFRAIRLYRLAASAGMPTAAKNLSRRYVQGLGLKNDDEVGLAFAIAAFNAGITDCAFPVSRQYEMGLGCSKDELRAYEYAKKGAEVGEVNSIYQLSRCYRLGIGVAADLQRANQLLEGALNGNAEMAWNWTETIDNSEWDCRVRWAGNDEARWLQLLRWTQTCQLSEYVTLLRQAAEKGVVVAMNDLGIAYAYCYWGAERNYDEAEKWLTQATTFGYAPAYYNLGLLYMNPAFIRKDASKAAHLILTSAEMDHAAAQHYLWAKRKEMPADCYRKCEAESWLEKAVAQKYPQAMKDKAIRLYESGEGNASCELLARLVEMGDPEAAFMLGKQHEEGGAAARDDDKAFRYISFAAQSGVASAMNELGRMYNEGVGVKQDREMAWNWIRKAADANDPIAICNLADLARHEGRFEDAMEFYRRSAELGYEPAREELAKLDKKAE